MSKRLALVAIVVLLLSMLPMALFGQTAQPFVAITEPAPGASISPTAVTVAGTATAMANTNVVVQALDANGAVLAEIPSPVNAPEGTAGPWQVNLTYSAPVGTPGVIRALLRGADGAVTAQATANVTYNLVPPPPPTSIDILAPVDGMIVSSDQLITVSGTSVSAQNNSIVVRILDAAGVAAGTPRTLGEQATVVDANNNWTVSFQITPETVPVVMTAVVRSATDGSTLAQDQVQVTLQTAAAPLPPTPVIVAATPPSAPLPSEPAAPIIEATPVPPPVVVGPDVVAPPAEVVLPAPTTIAVPTVLISSPSPGTLVDTANGVTVLGTAQSLLQNNVIVRLRDGFGRTLGEGATIVRADGTWQISLPVQVTANMPGTVYAFSSAPVGGRIVADDWVRVVFAGNCSERSDWPVYTVQAGDTLFDIAQATGSTVTELTAANCLATPNQIEPGQSLYVPLTPATIAQTPEQAPQVAIDPLPAAEADVTPNQPYTLNGTSSGTAPGSVYVRALDAAGVVLAETHAVRGLTAGCAGRLAVDGGAAAHGGQVRQPRPNRRLCLVGA